MPVTKVLNSIWSKIEENLNKDLIVVVDKVMQWQERNLGVNEQDLSVLKWHFLNFTPQLRIKKREKKIRKVVPLLFDEKLGSR